jgi:DnaJ domain
MHNLIDHYAILGVDASASPEEIKAAFKKLALQYHPDVYKGADANERMSQILQAYQTLNNLEARRNYDAQRLEHMHVRGSSDSVRKSSTHSKTEVSPGARRDRNRHYAFPDFFPGKPLHVDLVDIDYSLTPAETQQLVRKGLLRGSAPETKNQQYYCHRCHHRWRETGGRHILPHACPHCFASDWPEYLLLRCIHCSAIFESEQIRYEIGSVVYGKNATATKDRLCPPYELFPLCPYCGSANWSPSEDARVSELRSQAAQRATLLWLVLFGIALSAIVLVGLVAFNLWR